MGRTIRIVNYAVNGSGVGHLTRLVALNRWIRRYAAHAGVRAEIYFLTSSEADGMLFAERFASFKVPSKTAVGDAGIDKIAYIALAKQWVWHSLGLLRPDLLVVDTFPRGSFGELLSALDLCRKRAFVYRPMKDSFAGKPDFQAMLPLYDAIIVPEDEPHGRVQVPDEVRGRLRYVGPVAARERVEMVPRAEARDRLGIQGERLAIYVSAGGGGDPGAEADLLAVARALKDDADVHLVVGAGPLYRGRSLHGERITWLTQPGVAALFEAMDLAVCAAGYNSFTELMHVGVPTIFLPQEKVADEQHARADRAVRAGAAISVARSDVSALRAAVDGFRDPAARARAAAAARAVVPKNHARDGARELCKLVLTPSEVDAAGQAITDDLLATARDLGLEIDPFLELMRALDPIEDGIGGIEAERASAEATQLLRFAAEREIPIPAALRIAGALCRKIGVASPEERAGAARSLLAHFKAFDDWGGAATLLKVFGQERQLTAAAFAGELGSFLAGLTTRGEDLYRGIARLSRAQGIGSDMPSNQDLLRAAAEG